MPLMVNESGRPIYAENPLSATFTQAAASTSGMSSIPSLTVAAAAAVSATAAVGANTQPEIIKQQKAIQEGLDNQTPRNLMLTAMALLVLVMLLIHPRFLVRLMASLHRRKQVTEKRPYAYNSPPDSTTSLQTTTIKKQVGGGDLRSGWVLVAGKEVPPAIDNNSIKSDPFASSYDLNVGVCSSPPTQVPPPHVVPLLQHIPFSSTLLWAPFAKLPRWIASSVKLGELYLILGYLIANAFAMIWRSDITPTRADKGYGYNFQRTGLVALIQIPLVVALGVRGNIVGLCVGKGYEKLKRLHKIVGRVLFLAATLHTAFYLHKYAVKGILGTVFKTPFILAGLISWVAILLVGITSIPQIRESFYGVFKVCHIAGMIMLLIGMCFHVDVAIPWCVAALAIYGVSIICSLTKTRLAHAEFVALPGARTTVITIPALRSGWRAGQHVRLRIPALGTTMGLQGHPLTIASAPDGEGMVLMCKVAGDWSEKLFNFASNLSSMKGDEKSGLRPVVATVVLEGPYGGLGNTLLPSFSGVVLVAGGSGITQALSLAHDLVTRASTGVVRARTIDLIWSVRTEDAARPFMSTLLDMVEDAKAYEEKCLEGRKMRQDLPPPVALRVHVHVTRCPASSPITLLEPSCGMMRGSRKDLRQLLGRQPSAAEKEKAQYLSRNRINNLSVSSTASSTKSYYSALSAISTSRDRPDFNLAVNDVLEQVIDQAKRDRVDPSGVCVTACGPDSMMNSVRDAVRGVEGRKWRAAGGLEFEEEQFGF